MYKLTNHRPLSTSFLIFDDLKQEQFASQMISKFKTIFDEHNLKLWLKPFNIIATCEDGGLIQTVPDAISIDKLKKSYAEFTSLKQYFKQTFKYASRPQQTA